MKYSADITLKNNHFVVSGNLNFSNVMSIYKKSVQQAQPLPELIFDFAALQTSDSAGLALMVEWIKLSQQLNKPIRFLHVPKDILSIAKAAGIEGMLTEGSSLRGL